VEASTTVTATTTSLALTLSPAPAPPAPSAPVSSAPTSAISVSSVSAPASEEKKHMIDLIERLGYPLHTEAIQRTRDRQTHKGYDTDGYGYQFCVNRLNKEFGDEWGFSWEVIHEEKSISKSGSQLFDITVKMDIWVEKKDNTRSCVGSHISRTYGDALKGAITNGFKKTAAFWGVGRHAYEGRLDDDNDPYPDWAAQNGGDSKPDDQLNQLDQEQGQQADHGQGKQTGQAQQSSPENGQQPGQWQGQQPSQNQGKQASLENGKPASPNQGKQVSQQKGQQARQNQGKQSGQRQQASPPKQEDPLPLKNNGNGQDAGQQNGQTPPAPPAGNGKEAGLRRRIMAKLETIFSRSQEGMARWLKQYFNLTGVEDLNNLGADQLENVLEAVDKKFEEWKSGKNPS